VDLPLPAYFGMAAAVLAAYTVFGLTGFGSAIVAVPILVQFVPLHYAVPLVLLLDLVSTVALGARNWRHVERSEVFRLAPGMLAGVALGVTLLVAIPARPLLLLLGGFVLANAAWNLLAPQARQPVGILWALPAGVVGGAFGALFGTGGPVYTLYLARRLADMTIFRATISVVILMSAIVRLTAFTGAGLFAQAGLLISALALLPFCAAGVFAGSRLHGRLSPQRIKQALFSVLALGGLSVIARAVSL
jgi:uncharacterized protein